MQGDEEVDITVGDKLVYLATRLGDFLQAGVLGFSRKVRDEH